jgi:hypothetical protein
MNTINLYNHTVLLIASGQCPDSDTYKVMLLSVDASFDATHTTLSDISDYGANEVYGNGWPQGGVEIPCQWSINNTSGAKFAPTANVEQAISGGSVGPYSYYVVYNASKTNSPPLALITLEQARTINDGQDLDIVWNWSGLISIAIAT